jgi:hypothetical protein
MDNVRAFVSSSIGSTHTGGQHYGSRRRLGPSVLRLPAKDLDRKQGELVPVLLAIVVLHA